MIVEEIDQTEITLHPLCSSSVEGVLPLLALRPLRPGLRVETQSDVIWAAAKQKGQLAKMDRAGS